ncbi:MAG TPA: DUF192 domain-containing protein [Phycisphaerales bacterium]|nr:DUF192 domain-containing protein [Phycisphaerales bacterium]
MLISCEPKAPDGKTTVKIAGKAFQLDEALDELTRMKGLGGRASIPDDGGMIFVFPSIQVMQFVMRDCPVAIDVAFLDNSGRVLVFHEMTPEDPRKPGESKQAYEDRLKRYSSRFPARIAVETQGGMMKKLGLKAGDIIQFDKDSLLKRAK